MVYADVQNVPGERCDVDIINLAGQVVLSMQLNGNGRHVLGAGFSSGIYIVHFVVQHQAFFSEDIYKQLITQT